MDPLFPPMPKDLSKVSDTEVNELLAEHTAASDLIVADDPEFLKDLPADEIIKQFETGVEQIKTLRAELAARETAAENYQSRKDELAAAARGETVNDEPSGEEPAETPQAEAETDETDETVEETVEEKELVLVASAEESEEPETPRMLRRPPAPAADRIVVNEPEQKTLSFVASGMLPSTPPGTRFDSLGEIVEAQTRLARSLGKPNKRVGGIEERYPVAQLDYRENFPEERTLHKTDWQANSEKIAAVGSPFIGGRKGREALVASGGLCAPLEPIYSMPQYAVTDRPVRDALPNFRAERGGVNVPVATTIGDITTAITVIEAADDALGGTFATKSCQTLDCPQYDETTVTVIAHCREFGNLNAMAWPEKIAHENELTMAAHARTAEEYLLDRIKSLSVNVTSGAETLGALIYLVDAIVKARFGIVSRLRMNPETVFTALLPAVLPDLLQLDTVQTQFGRYTSEEELVAYLRGLDINPVFYIDTPTTGEAQIASVDQAAGALDDLPDTIQWALFPAGAFLHIDMAELNLGIVRDSTLNSTNDFQVFGETFENVARIGPPQAAYWVTTDLCANGNFPPAGTTRTCDSGVQSPIT